MKNVLKVTTLAVLGCAFIGGETQGMWDKLQASVAKNPRKVNQYRAKRGLAPLDPAQIRAAAKPTGGQRFGGTVNSKNSVLNDQSSSDEEEVVLSTENLDEPVFEDTTGSGAVPYAELFGCMCESADEMSSELSQPSNLDWFGRMYVAINAVIDDNPVLADRFKLVFKYDQEGSLCKALYDAAESEDGAISVSQEAWDELGRLRDYLGQ